MENLLMQIYVDADACPVVDIVEKTARKYQIPVTDVYKRQSMWRLQKISCVLLCPKNYRAWIPMRDFLSMQKRWRLSLIHI